MVIPFMSSAWLIELVKKAQIDVDVEHHGGGHDLGGQPVMAKLLRFICDSQVASTDEKTEKEKAQARAERRAAFLKKQEALNAAKPAGQQDTCCVKKT